MDFNKDELLNKTKDELKNEISTIGFNTWIKPLSIRNIVGNHIYFTGISEFHKDFIEKKYADLISNTLQYITNKEWTFSVVNVEDSESFSNSSDDDKSSDLPSAQVSANRATLDPKHTFETFVVGDNNRLAQAAALAVANNPGGANTYNPLFLYGGVGLGKTHLMHAIANKILDNNSNAKALYVTSEKFTNQLINAIQDYKMEIFRNKYRTIDVLLIDDIQFIAGKDRVQEEFFHTFNTLRDAGKQIIISSDKQPREIALLEDRLKSRFDGGLLADIDSPDYETRFAILRKKAQEENVVIEKSINEFRAENEKVISSDYIKSTVSKYFNIDKEALSSNKRSNDIAFPRQIAMYLCRSVANMSFPKIGEDFGNRDHSTVMHAYKKIDKEIKQKESTKRIVESVKNIITKDER